MQPQTLRADQLTYLLTTLKGCYHQAHVAKILDDRAAARQELETSIATTREAIQLLARQGTGNDPALARLEHELIGYSELASASLQRIPRSE